MTETTMMNNENGLRNGIVIATDADFNAVIRPLEGGLVLVDFWAPWCGPCLAMAPVLEQLARDHAGTVTIAKLDLTENPATAEAAGATSIPLLVLYRDGVEVSRRIGSAPGGAVSSWIGKHC